jgi:hypothetical protein
MSTIRSILKGPVGLRGGSRVIGILIGFAISSAGASTGCGGTGDPPAGSPEGTGGHATTSGDASSGGNAGAAGAGGADTDAATEETGDGGAAGSGGALGDDAGTGGSATTDGGSDGEVASGDGGVHPADSVVWAIDNLQSIGGHPTSVLGTPMVIDTPGGKAVQFDGVGDALFVENHPLAGFPQFTVEVVFRPDAGGAAEQRFFHIQENGANDINRVLFETRLPGNGVWVIDNYVQSTAGGAALFDAKLVHPLGPWYSATLVVDGTEIRNYVNGIPETSAKLPFQPHMQGRTSLGVRINKLYWYKGAIRLARFTPRVLAPAEFLKAD